MTNLIAVGGAIEEFDEICRITNPSQKAVIINLRGHGCIMAGQNVSDLDYEDEFFRARPIEERHPNV